MSKAEHALDEAGRLLSRRVGLRLDPAIRGRLGRAVRDEAVRSGTSESDYVARLDGDPDLLQELLNLVTVQETSFFRDPGQFVALAEHILPTLRDAGQPVRVWSAGCSNGQEPYSLAMTLAESGIRDWRVVASDISTNALERTRRARYRERELRGLSPARRDRFLAPASNEWEVDPALKERVTVVRLNLAADPPPFAYGECSVVFCRNVLIYFQHDDVVAFLDRLAARLPPTGHLFLGYSESLWQVTKRFHLMRLGEAFAYQTGPGTPTVEVPPVVARPERKVAAPLERPTPRPALRPVEEPQGSTELMTEGEAALGRGDHVEAIAAFRKAAFVDPDHPVAHLNLGLALEVAGDGPAARRAYGAARAALERCDTAVVELTLEGYHLDDLVALLDRKVDDR